MADGKTRREEGPAPGGGQRDFLRQVLIFHGTGLLFLAALALLWFAGDVLLLVFAGILLAVLLHDASCRLQRRLPLAHGPALAAVILAALLVLGLGGWLLAPGVAEQAGELYDAIPRALQRLQGALERYGIFQKIQGSLPAPEKVMSQATAMLARAGVFFSGAVGALANAVIVAVIGMYFAARPEVYIGGLVTLMPMGKRPRARQVLQAIGHTLAEWLLGKLLSMVIIGAITAIGLALLQVPLALVLGLLAGLLDFIPYIGPILAGVPAVLIAFSENPMLALYVVLLFIGVQAAEGYLLLPLIERRTVSLPPALTIIMQVFLGAFFGLAGVALATPLTAVLAVLVSMLYVQDVLGDPVAIPGER